MTVSGRQISPAVQSPSDLFSSVVEALSELAPAERYLRTNIMVPSGHFIGDDCSRELSACVSAVSGRCHILPSIVHSFIELLLVY